MSNRFDWERQRRIRALLKSADETLESSCDTPELLSLYAKAIRGAVRHEREHRGVFGPDMKARRVWRAPATVCGLQLVVRWLLEYDPKKPVTPADFEGSPPGRLEAFALAEKLEKLGKRPALKECEGIEYTHLAGSASDVGGMRTWEGGFRGL